MKNLRLLILGFVLSGVVYSQATTFDYSYTFGTGDVVSGSLQGDASGDFVNNVANVTVFFNGTAMSGTVFTARWQSGSPSYVAGPIVSFDVHKNDFVFVNSDLAAGDNSWTEFIQVINGGVFGTDFANAKLPGSSSIIQELSFGAWSLTREPDNGSLPDAGSTALMFGSAAAGLALFRRKV